MLNKSTLKSMLFGKLVQNP